MSTKAQCANTPATSPPTVCERIALEVKFLYPKESSIAVCVLR